LVQPFDNLDRRVPGHADALPATRFIVRMSGNDGARAAVVTARARSLPALICSIEVPIRSNMTCTSPVSSAASASGVVMDQDRVSCSMSNPVADRGPRRRKSLNPGRPRQSVRVGRNSCRPEFCL
jgi:hypothetical protein